MATIALLVATAVGGLLLRSSDGPRHAEPPHRAVVLRPGGLAIRAVRAGRGPQVVLLHGYGESLMSWRGIFDMLTPEHDVTALDLPGFGLSSKPRHGYAVESMARAVLEAMDSAAIARATLIGHSLGGAVAAALALAAPQRVIALVLISPAGVAAPWDSGDSLPGLARAAVAEYEVQRTRFTSSHDPEWLAEEPLAEAYLPAADTAYRVALGAILEEFDFTWLTPDRIAALRLPTMVLWGEFDQVLPPAHGRFLAANLPDGRLVVVQRSWHRPHVERPAVTAGLIRDFLAHLPDSTHYH